MKEVSKHTGYNITDLKGLEYLYSTLYTESSLGLHLPEWTQDIFPDGKLSDADFLFFELLSHDQLKNLYGGMFKSHIYIYKLSIIILIIIS